MNTRTWRVAVAAGAVTLGLGGFAAAGADQSSTTEGGDAQHAQKQTGLMRAATNPGSESRPAWVTQKLLDKAEGFDADVDSPASPTTTQSPGTADEMTDPATDDTTAGATGTGDAVTSGDSASSDDTAQASGSPQSAPTAQSAPSPQSPATPPSPPTADEASAAGDDGSQWADDSGDRQGSAQSAQSAQSPQSPQTAPTADHED